MGGFWENYLNQCHSHVMYLLHLNHFIKLLRVIDSASLLRIFYRQGITPGSGCGKDERLTKLYR